MQLVGSQEAAKALVIAGGADDGGDVIDEGGVKEGETRVDGMEPEGPGPVP